MSSQSPPNAAAAERPRLTEREKKQNHIRSEQKRREAIREGFDRLARIVPGMEGQGRSEAVVLEATLQHMREQIARRKQLIAEGRARGIDTSEWELDVMTMTQYERQIVRGEKEQAEQQQQMEQQPPSLSQT